MPFKTDDVFNLRCDIGVDHERFSRMIGVSSRAVRRWETDECRGKYIVGSAGEVLAAIAVSMTVWPEETRRFLEKKSQVGGLSYIISELLRIVITKGIKNEV